MPTLSSIFMPWDRASQRSDDALARAIAEINLDFDGTRSAQRRADAAARMEREAALLEAGLPVADADGVMRPALPGVAEKWAPRLRAEARELQSASDLARDAGVPFNLDAVVA